MTHPSLRTRQQPASTLAGLTAAVVTAMVGAPLPGLAQPASQLDTATFPPVSLFREIQLETMACGRDNTAQPCDKARALADPLMDHPRLPASCKDTVWNIRERAVVAAKNSYGRRETLNRDATDLMALCKPASKPIGSGAQQASEPEKKSGGLGGFLRGLGFGGGKSNER